MIDLAPLVYLVGTIAALLLLAAGLVFMSAVGAEQPIGPLRRVRQPRRAHVLPRSLADLTRDERNGWRHGYQWSVVTAHVREIATTIGAGEPAEPEPKRASLGWLDRRVRELEAAAGPMLDLHPSADRPEPRPRRRRRRS